MNGIRFGENMLVRPLYSGLGASADETAWVDVSKAQWVTFYIIGQADTATTLHIEASSAASTNASCEDIAFWYRVSGTMSTAAAGMGADTWGAITTADSAGFSYTNGALLLDVDPAVLPVLNANFRYLHIRFDAVTSYVATPPWGITAFLEPRNTNRTYTT